MSGRGHGTDAPILAVDGGNSKVDVALVAPDGSLVAAVRGATISHQAVPLEEGVRRLGTLVATAREAAARDRGPRAASGDDHGLREAIYCLAGADYPSDIRLLRSAFGAAVPADDILVLNDTFAALRAGSTRPWGIALICGHGINGAAVAPNGRRVRFAGVGDISGDWGGGTSIGTDAGRGPSSNGRSRPPSACADRRR